MTQEDKELLLKDLCARLPYRVKIQVYYEEMAGSGCFDDTVWTIDNDEPFHVNDRWIENIKPYLFPLSSMTEEQIKEFNSITLKCNTYTGKSILLTDFCNKHHIDWRGFIEKGLAIDATGLNIY